MYRAMKIMVVVACMNSNVHAENIKPMWLQFSDQLILKYHLTSMKKFPSADQLVAELKNPSPDFESVANDYRREKDSLKKREKANVLVEKMYNTSLPPESEVIAYFDRVYLQEYDFDKKGFSLCFNQNCEKRPEKVSEKFGTKKYELLVGNIGTSYFFSLNENTSKVLESLASKGTGWNYRSIPAVVVVKPVSTDDSKKWSDGTSYNVLKSELIGIYLLNDSKFNRREFPKASEIAYYVEYR